MYPVIIMLYFTDLGERWAPAVLDSEEELAFIRGGEIGNNVPNNYWIGGSTDADSGSILQYSDYITSREGNCIITQGYYMVFVYNK